MTVLDRDAHEVNGQKKYHFTISKTTVNSVPANRNFSGLVLYFDRLKSP